MKIGITRYPFTGVDRTFDQLKKFGFDTVDYCLVDTNALPYVLEGEELEALLNEEKALAKRAGIEISQIHGPWRGPQTDYTEEGRAERLEKMKKSVVIASLLRAKNVVIHPIMPFGIEDKKIGKEKETRELNLAHYRELVAYAKDFGVNVCLENMPFTNFSISTPTEILDFVNEIGAVNFRICLDTGHVAAFGDKLSLSDEVRAIGSKLEVLHVHDSIPGKDLHMIPCFGSLDFPEFVKSLRNVGFCGSFSAEAAPSSKLPENIRDSLYGTISEILRDLVKD